MKYFFLFGFLLFGHMSFAQYPTLSEKAEVSLVTVGPGKYLYDCFGHNAIRIKDPAIALNRAYNYGTYDSFDDGFYLKFTMGTTDYKLSAYSFDRFEQTYRRQNRWMKEQVLDLTQDEKQQIFEYVENNAKPENAYYRYDPFFDNCATRLRDVPKFVLGDKLTFYADHLEKESTIRQLKDDNAFNHPWINLGIDIALGNILDRTATLEQHMYLPDYIFSGYANATIMRGGKEVPAVKSTRDVIVTDYWERPIQKLQPWLVFSILALVVILITARDYLKGTRARILDFLIYLLTGLVGALIVFLWFISSHYTAANNLNVLWAFFPNLVVAFYMLKKKPPVWTRVYARLLVILLIAMALVWITQFQSYHMAMLPLMILFGTRYVFLWQKGLVRKN